MATATTERRLGRELSDLTVVSPRLVAYNVAYLALAWLVALAAIAIAAAHPRWWTIAIAFVVVSSRQQALLNCEHEANHLKFLPSRAWNDFVGRYLAAAPVGSPFAAARARHLAHHRLVGTPEDPDHALHAGPQMRERRGLAMHFLRGVCGAYAGMVLMGPPDRDARSAPGAAQDLVALVVVQLALAAGLTLAFGWWTYPALWLAPLATVTTLCHLLRSFVEHAITDTEETSHGDRMITIASNPLERALVSPYNMNLHAEHHFNPGVPAPRLPEMRRRLSGRDDVHPVLVRPSYGAAIRLYARALKR